MQAGQPSITARRAAAHRVVHQLLEHGAIFSDPLALRMLGEGPEALLADAAAHPERRGMRLFIAARHRFADEAIAAAFVRGTRQLVVLGAGLDTTAYRNTHADLKVFEVDHPATQAWKRERLTGAAITIPATARFVGVDFERDNQSERLAAAGFDEGRASLFIWLGVVPYLTRAAIFETLAFIARCNHSEVIFDYGEPLETAPPDARVAREQRAASVAAVGEPWLTYFHPLALRVELHKLGFTEVEDLDTTAVAERYLQMIEPRQARGGGHLLHARR